MNTLIRILLFSTFLLAQYVGVAQSNGQEGSLETILNDSILWQEALPISEVATFAQETTNLLDQMNGGLKEHSLSTLFNDDWDSIYNEIKVKDVELQIDSSSIINPTALENSIVEWRLYRQKVDDWNDKLDESIEWTSLNLDRLKKLSSLWNATRQNALEINAVEAVMNLINDTRSEIRVTSLTFNKSFNELLAKQILVSELNQIVESKERLLQQAKDQSVRSLLLPDRPLLWDDIKYNLIGKEEFAARFNNIVNRRKQEYGALFNSYRYNIICL